MPTRRPIETAFSTRAASVDGGRSPVERAWGPAAGRTREFGRRRQRLRTPPFAPRCAARYSSRYFFTVSNASAGMIFPRTWG